MSVRKKNVILITIDVLRKDMLGCYGNRNGVSPCIDSLAVRSIRFTRNQASGPYTQASFPGLLTSSYFLEYGKPAPRLSPKRTLISEVLKGAGITTVGFHSNPYLSGDAGWNRGWHLFYDSMKDKVEPMLPYIRGDKITQKAIQWANSYLQDDDYRPFFLWVHYMDVHEPYVPEKQFVEMLYPEIALSKQEMFDMFRTYVINQNVSNPEKVDTLRKLYEIHVRETDAYIELLLNTLNAKGVLNDSAVILTSDHGDEFGEHGGLSHRDKMFSELIDTPLLISGLGESRDCRALVSNVDLAPTICHLMGVAPSENWAGQSLLPLEKYTPKPAFGEAIDMKSKKGGDMERDIYFCRRDELKIIYRPVEDRWEMFDLMADPSEATNIAEIHPEYLSMKELLIPRIRRWKSPTAIA